MTRVLVCGATIMEDTSFVFNSLCEANRIYGPFTCVIHSNHPQALAWQQWAMRKQDVKHRPVVEWAADGTLAGSRCRDRMFEAKPDYVVIFEITPSKNDVDPKPQPGDKRAKVEYILHRAQSDGLPVIRYTFDPVEEKLKKAAAKAAAKPSRPDKARPSDHRPSSDQALPLDRLPLVDASPASATP